MDRVAAFGIGSTNFRYVAATSTGEFLTDTVVEPTRPGNLCAQVLDAVDDLRATVRSIDAVAVSTTGLVDADRGAVRDFDTPGGDVVDRIGLGAALDAGRSLPLYLENDCSAAALGEWHFGERTDETCIAHVTMGTGIGGGVVERGRLQRGGAGQAGEFGLIPVAPHEFESTGVTGAWEAVCSGRGIARFVRRRLDATDADSRLHEAAREGGLTAEAVFDAASDDPFARRCLDEVGRYNAAGIGAIANVANPDLVTLGGGVALNNVERVLDGIRSDLDEFCFVDPPEIRPTGLGDDVGLYGALATYRTRSGRDSVAESAPESAVDATD